MGNIKKRRAVDIIEGELCMGTKEDKENITDKICLYIAICSLWLIVFMVASAFASWIGAYIVGIAFSVWLVIRTYRRKRAGVFYSSFNI
jgi:Flp pilus assembly protein TadB